MSLAQILQYQQGWQINCEPKCYQNEICLTKTAVEVFIGYSDHANDLGFIPIGNQTIQTIYPGMDDY